MHRIERKQNRQRPIYHILPKSSSISYICMILPFTFRIFMSVAQTHSWIWHRLDNPNVIWYFDLLATSLEAFDWKMLIYPISMWCYAEHIFHGLYLQCTMFLFFYSIQSRLKPGVTQGMLVHFNCIFSLVFFIFGFFFGAWFQLLPWAGDWWLIVFCFWFWILINLNLAVRCIFNAL